MKHLRMYESNDEIKSVLNALNKYTSYAPYHDDKFGWVSTIYTKSFKGDDKKLENDIGEYIKWKCKFDYDDAIDIKSIHTPMLYDDLDVYNDSKKLLFIQFSTDKFPDSKLSLTKKDFEEFNEFRKNPGMFKETEKYNL